ncbi:hypothetical protein [Synechococcus sp. W4D4]|uniref:hypothetical protein n=1 Tax=Synechococcus sp. W4D4 TaxID=3392294 RepID=UPI0039EB346D
MSEQEIQERIAAGWHVEPPTLELIERDYDSPQRKRFVRSQQQLKFLFTAKVDRFQL